MLLSIVDSLLYTLSILLLAAMSINVILYLDLYSEFVKDEMKTSNLILQHSLIYQYLSYITYLLILFKNFLLTIDRLNSN